MRTKSKFNLWTLVPATALIFLVAIFSWWKWSLLPVADQAEVAEQIFLINRGENLSSVAGRLKQEGLIRSAFAFKILALTKGLTVKIQAGDFRLSPAMAPEEIAGLLTHGSLDVWLTFPEGWRREEYARRLAGNLDGFNGLEFVGLTAEWEGRLFPDTYLIPKAALPVAVAETMKRNFDRKLTVDLEKKASEKGLSNNQVVILASIVEREARSKASKPIVAGILVKRWQNGWPLQADATIQYAKANQQFNNLTTKQLDGFDWWPRDLTKADLGIDSPYNTYRYNGLPPAPICNPGLFSIEAVVNFQETPYWFYLSDLQGQMHYAETINEHNQNIAAYLR